MENAIEIKNLRKMWGKNGAQNISFSLPQGYIMGFVGKNGAGKTTTIKAILNMLQIDSGEIKIFGKDYLVHEAEIKQKIGVVMDSPFYEQEWTLAQIGQVLKPFYPSWSDEKFSSMLEQFNLDPKKKVKELSRGMKMKIMVSCALAHEPDLLILDEPTSGLDAVARDELLEILQSFISDGTKSVLFSTHITTDLEKIADYLTFIENGKIVHSDTKDNMLEKYVVVKGGKGILSEEQKKLIIGFHETKVGFDGITEKSNLKDLPKTLVTEKCTMDELVVRFNKEGRKNA